MFNLNLCILCQKEDTSSVTSGLTGRSSVKRAAEIHNDIVAKRLRSISCEGSVDENKKIFVYYYTKKCYKNCTHQETQVMQN